MEVLIPFFVVTLLLLANALFVAAEFSLIGGSRAAIERLAAGKSGERGAARSVHAILQDPRRQDRYIATAQLGITLASLGLGMYGEHALASWLAERLEVLGAGRWIAAHALASALAVLLFSYLHIVFGEMVPKSLALMHAERVVLSINRPMLWIQTLSYPLVAGLNGLGNGILRLLGVRRELAAEHYHTTEELQQIVAESQQSGALRQESGQVLRELFEFGELTAEEVMVPRVHITGVPLDADPPTIAEILHTSRYTRYPVFEGDLDHIVGVVHIKDLLRLLVEGRPLIRAEVRETRFVPHGAELDTVLAAMRQARTHMVILMDEHGGTAGLVTSADLTAEVVGEVAEGREDSRELYRDKAGKLRAAGTLRLDELGEHFDMTLEHPEIDTVSGLVLALLERPPRIGDTVTYADIRFEVSAVAGYGVAECVVTRVERPE